MVGGRLIDITKIRNTRGQLICVRVLISLFLGYIFAAAFTTSVSMTPTLTAWGSFWTYASILGFTIVIDFSIVAVFFITVAVFFILAGLGITAAETSARRW